MHSFHFSDSVFVFALDGGREGGMAEEEAGTTVSLISLLVAV